ncbi:hypothetical protein FocTR4_00002207, partial [Fusarium oxysporum f. sp. cubense]
MSENHDQESHNSIRILATECETILQNLIDSETQRAAKGLFEEYLQRLSTWAAYLGIFARPSQCLDHRLSNAIDIQDLVLRGLDSLGRSLTSKERQGTARPGPELGSLRKPVLNYGASVQIRNRSLAPPTSLSPCKFWQHLNAGASNLDLNKTTSIAIHRSSYPPPPKPQRQEPRLCEWCGEPLKGRDMDPVDWRQHVDNDLKPYICLAEHCTIAVGYPSFREWSSHMQQHNEFCESRSEGNTKKRKTKRHQFNVTEIFSSTEDEEDQSHKANNHESMTRHIAAHLQTLMFLTLRVISMQKGLGSEDEDAAESNAGTNDVQDYQVSRHLDEPPSFEDVNHQSELPWLPAAETYSFHFDTQERTVVRYPTLLAIKIRLDLLMTAAATQFPDGN